MNVIDRVGAFRGTPMEWAVSETKEKKFPQFVVRLAAKEFYDETGELTGGEPGWVDWTPYDMSITAYLVLFNDKGPLLNFEQLQKALGWDGSSFSALAEGNWAESNVLFRVEENTYNGETKNQVNWIDAPDAPVTRSLTSLDPAKLKDLDGKFAGMLNGKAKPAPASAPKPAVAAPKPAAASKPAATPAAKPAPAPAAPKATAKPPAVAKPAASAECSKEDAWTVLMTKKESTVTDDAVAEAWLEACTAVGGEKSEDDFTNTDWAGVRDHAANKLNIIPFG